VRGVGLHAQRAQARGVAAMMNPKYKRYADRLRTLIAEAQSLIDAQEPGYMSGPVVAEATALYSWYVKVGSLVYLVFKQDSQHARQLERVTERRRYEVGTVKAVKGVLIGALDDLENGFLIGQEFLVAGEVFDSVLGQARDLLGGGYKDVAAVLGRVVLEDALRRIARQEGLDPTQKASKLNDELKNAQRYGQPQWRQIQAWMDIGNSAAHGKFTDYDLQAASDMLDGIERFLAAELRL